MTVKIGPLYEKIKFSKCPRAPPLCNVVCYYFKIRPAATLIFSLNVSIFHSGWCEEVGVDT